jgi:thiosulfate reductase cytochrome b subunit
MSSSEDTSEKTQLAVMANDLGYIKGAVLEIKTRLEKEYVTKEEFNPVKKIAYGVVGVILIAVVGAIVKLVIAK